MKPNRKALELGFRSDYVLSVAERVFADAGFQGASVERIARECELSVGSLYGLFPGKEALFAAVIERRQHEFLRGVGPVLAGAAPARDRVERFVDFTFDYFDRNASLFHLYVGATSGFQWSIRPTLGERSFRAHLALVEALAELCREGAREDGWVEADAVGLAWAVVGALNGFLTRWITTAPRPSLRVQAGEAQQIVLRLVGAHPHRDRE